MSENVSARFLRGAAILALAGFISRFLGLFYRMVLTRAIGTDGVGLYQLAYPLYTFLLVFSVSGIPVALAKLVSEKLALNQGKEAYRIFRIARNVSLIFGIVATIFLILMAKPLTVIFNFDPRGYYSIVAIAPAILVVSVMAAYRGFFQGMQNMKPTAYSQVIEQIIRMVTIVGLAYLLLPYGVEMAAAGATFSAVTGAIAGLLVMLFIYYRKKMDITLEMQEGVESSDTSWEIIKRIAKYAIPVIVAASVVQLMSLVSLFFVPSRLVAVGFKVAEATALYGELTGVALVLVHFPEIITVSLQTSLIPAISAAHALGLIDVIKERVMTSLKMAVLISTPSAVGLYILAKPLCGVLFDVNSPSAILSLRILALGVVFIALQQISSGILQGVGKINIPARNLLIGAGINAVFSYLFITPKLGVQGAALATMAAFAAAAVLNLYHVRKSVQITIRVGQILLKPLISSGIMGVAVWLGYYGLKAGLVAIHGPLPEAFALMFSILIGVVVYFLMMIFTGGLTKEDLQLLPGTGRLVRPLQRLGILKA